MIIPEKLQNRADYKACVDFHGHTCMGLTLGYFAAKLGMQYLSERRALDEELVCISETDACCCDAIQVLTGCTFGKGNFIHKDIGKMAFSFISRTSSIGVRLSMKPGVMDIPEDEQNLLNKIRSQNASPDDIKEYEKLHENRSKELFEKGPGAFFSIEELQTAMPRMARMAPSQPCENCREPVMETKLQDVDGKKLCRSCSKPRQLDFKDENMNIDNLTKVTVEIQFNGKTAGSAPGLNNTVRFNFIFGVASSGMSTFEREIYMKSAGDTLSISVPRTSAPDYFGHLYQHLYHHLKSTIMPDVFNLDVSILAVQKSEEREVVNALTQSLGHGCGGGSCGCGCS